MLAFTAPALDFHALAPEIVLVGVISLMILVDVVQLERARSIIGSLAGLGLLGAIIPLLTLAASDHEVRSMFGGAYVVERFKDSVDAIDFRAMSMQSGYTDLTYTSCVSAASVQDCLNTGKNGQLTPSAVDHFFYGGGHFQKQAVDLGLGALGNSALGAEVKKYVGAELDLGYSSPQPAGGLQTTPTAYAAFLRKLLAGQLALSAKLGARPVCTLPAACPTALSSPAPYAWHYSYGHWVEDEPDTGDGAFSSPGAFGFYPWVDASKSYYGILARYSLSSQAYLESAACGRLLRKAFITGIAQ